MSSRRGSGCPDHDSSDGRSRRILVIARYPGEGPLTEPTGYFRLAGGNWSSCPKATFRETAAPAWLEIDTRHARTMSAVARAAWRGSQRLCVKLT